MLIEEYFKNIKQAKTDMETAYKNYIEHIFLMCEISGTDFSKERVSGSRIIKGLESDIIDDEDFATDYKRACKTFKQQKEECLKDINRLSKTIYKLIIEYAYINEESTKEIAESLRKYHNKQYSEFYIGKMKSEAVREFNDLISKKEKVRNCI